MRVTIIYHKKGFSALQRAEIAEMSTWYDEKIGAEGFSALQRAEIAEIRYARTFAPVDRQFQCSSTSRNC